MPKPSEVAKNAGNAAAKAVREVETVVVEILTRVEHDGEVFLAGAKAELSKLAAEALIRVGAAKPAAAPVAAPEAPPAQ